MTRSRRSGSAAASHEAAISGASARRYRRVRAQRNRARVPEAAHYAGDPHPLAFRELPLPSRERNRQSHMRLRCSIRGEGNAPGRLRMSEALGAEPRSMPRGRECVTAPNHEGTLRLHRRRRRLGGLRRGGAAGQGGRRARAAARGRPLAPPPAARHAAGHLQDDQRQQVHALPPDGAAGAPRRPRPRHPAGQRARRRLVGQRAGLHARPAVRLRRVARAPARQQRRAPAGAGPTCCRTSAAWRATTGSTTSGTAPTGRCWSPTPATSTTSRAGSCRACRRMGEPFNHDFNGPTPARRRLLPVHEPARQAQQRRLRLHRAAEGRPRPDRPAPRRGAAASRSRTAAPSASPIATRTGRERTRPRRAARSSSPPARWSRRKLLMLSGIGPADQLRAHGSPSSSTCRASART